jgi:hypothetical protein
MLRRILTKAGIICLVLILGTWLIPDVHAQTQGRRGQPPPRQGQAPPSGQSGEQSQQAAPEESTPFVHGVYLGFGVGTYHGDIDGNPNEDPIGFLGNATLRLEVGADHRLGTYDQFGIGTRLSFEQLDGAARGWGSNPREPLKFDASLVNLDIVGSYELPYIQQGFMRVFAGGGPSLIVNPTYEGFPAESNLEEQYQSLFKRNLGTRVTASVVAGVTFLDAFRIGVRILPSDYVDGYEGFGGGRDAPDVVGFISFGHRFDLKY